MSAKQMQIGASATAMAAAASIAIAQNQMPRGAQRVDPGVGDVGVVEGVSRADLFKDLRKERGFESVYRLESRPPMGIPGTASTVYMRVDGGVTAVFPESVYQRDAWGVYPAIPPGTTFYIGPLPESFGAAPASLPRSANYVDTRVNLQAQPMPSSISVVPDRSPETSSPSIWDDEAHRQRLVARLMQRAAETSR